MPEQDKIQNNDVIAGRQEWLLLAHCECAAAIFHRQRLRHNNGDGMRKLQNVLKTTMMWEMSLYPFSDDDEHGEDAADG